VTGAGMPVELRRVLGRRDVLALAFGAMVGWGWVVLAGEMVVLGGSFGSMLAFGVGAVMVLLVGLTYAELTSALSRAGGELAFTYAGIGPRTSLFCGWTLGLAYLSVCAFEAAALPTVVGYLVPGFEQGFLYSVAGWDVHASWVAVGAGGALLVGWINYRGVKLAAAAQWMAALVLLAIGISFFVPGTARGEMANLAPEFTTLDGFLRVVMMTPFLFVGFDVIPQIAEEVNIPFRAIGRILLVSIVLAMGWYMAVQWTVAITLDDAALGTAQLPTADAMSAVYGSPWAGRLLVFAGLMGILTSWNAFFVGGSRLLFSMARAGMLPPVFARLHSRHGSPLAAIALLTGLSMLAPLFGRQVMVWLVDAGSFAAVIAYFLVAISFVRLRRLHPSLPRPYKAPLPALTGAAAIVATMLFLLLYLPIPGSAASLVWPAEWLIVATWAALGTLLAFATPGLRGRLGSDEQTNALLGPYAANLDASASRAPASARAR
jgi:basic amino acid/polyamine antiporter, APA family